MPYGVIFQKKKKKKKGFLTSYHPETLSSSFKKLFKNIDISL